MAMYLMLVDQGWIPGDPEKGFEAVFVDHGTDWPETYKYVEMFKAEYPLTVLKPKVNMLTPIERKFSNLYDYSHARKMFPHRKIRWCTGKFKVEVFDSYVNPDCFIFIGFDWGERHRAAVSSKNGMEYRWPLIENEIDRDGCKQIIKNHNIAVPKKSGCYICPFQRVGQLRELRRKHPDLFCKLEQLENRNNRHRAINGYEPKWPWVKAPYYSFKKPVRQVAEKGIDQRKLFEEDEYPPCECGL